MADVCLTLGSQTFLLSVGLANKLPCFRSRFSYSVIWKDSTDTHWKSRRSECCFKLGNESVGTLRICSFTFGYHESSEGTCWKSYLFIIRTSRSRWRGYCGLCAENKRQTGENDHTGTAEHESSSENLVQQRNGFPTRTVGVVVAQCKWQQAAGQMGWALQSTKMPW